MADLPKCLSLLRGHAAYDSATLGRLPTFWGRLFQDAAILLGVVEDGVGPQCELLAFGASVFVTDAFMARERSGEQPYLTARAIEAELQGPSPILRPPMIRIAQARGGLSLLNLHFAEVKTSLSADEQHQVRFVLFESFLAQQRGHRIKEVLQELWDDEIPAPYILTGWGQVRSYYPGFTATLVPGEPRPYLVGLTREEARTFPGRLATPVFVWVPSRFGFSPAEQALLDAALGGETDRDLAHSLGLALPTIKSQMASDLRPRRSRRPPAPAGPTRRQRQAR